MKPIAPVIAVLAGVLVGMSLASCSSKAPAPVKATATTTASTSQATTFPADWTQAAVEARMLVVSENFLDDFGVATELRPAGALGIPTTQPTGVQVMAIDHWTLSLMSRASQADKRTMTLTAARVTVRRGKAGTLVFAAMRPEFGEMQLDFSVETSEVTIRGKFNKLTQGFGAGEGGGATNRGTLKIPEPGFPVEGTCKAGETFCIVGPKFEYGDEKAARPGVVLILVRATFVSNKNN